MIHVPRQGWAVRSGFTSLCIALVGVVVGGCANVVRAQRVNEKNHTDSHQPTFTVYNFQISGVHAALFTRTRTTTHNASDHRPIRRGSLSLVPVARASTRETPSQSRGRDHDPLKSSASPKFADQNNAQPSPWLEIVAPMIETWGWSVEYAALLLHPVYYGINVPRGRGQQVLLIPG